MTVAATSPTSAWSPGSSVSQTPPTREQFGAWYCSLSAEGRANADRFFKFISTHSEDENQQFMRYLDGMAGAQHLSASGDPTTASEDTASAPAEAGSVRAKVVALAQQEAAKKVSEQGTPDEVKKYSGSVLGNGGNNTQAWCAYFVSWLFNQAGAPLVDANGDGGVTNIVNWAKGAGRFQPASATPKPGDAVVVHWDGNPGEQTNHIGIVESVDADGTVNTIEGNVHDSVDRLTYKGGSAGAQHIVGFVSAE